MNQRKWRSCPLSPQYISDSLQELNTIASFQEVISTVCILLSPSRLWQKGSFVFLFLLTVFVPLPHCHETLTVKGQNCLHQRPALERVQIQLQHLENLFHMYQMSVEYFSAASERHLSHPQVNWPRRHVGAIRSAQSLRRSRLSFPMKHDQGCWWGFLGAFFYCNPLHFLPGTPLPGPGAITSYMLTIWPSEPLMEFG